MVGYTHWAHLHCSRATMHDFETDLGERIELMTWAGPGEVLTGAN